MPSVGDSLQLTRSDLAGFPETSIKYVLLIQKEKGWRGIRSNRSHLALLSPDGKERYGLSSNPDGLLWLKRDVNRYYASKKEEEKPVKTKSTKEKYVCPRDHCPKVFNSLENLDLHINVDHEGQVKCPDCKETFKDNLFLGRHRGRAHGYKSPRYELRKKQEAARAKADREEKRAEAIDDLVKMGIDDDIKPVMDSMPLEHLVPSDDQVSLKGFSKIFAPPEIQEKTGSLFTTDYLDPKGEPEVEHISFIDDRDSWTLDLSNIGELTVENIIRNMAAAGLNLEIRVWKETR